MPDLKLPRFTDREGRFWDVDINVLTIGRVRKALDINLLELVLPESTLAEKLSDPVLIVNVLYVLCKDQADAASITDEQFGQSLTRDSIEDGWEAVLEGVVNFSPRGVRPAYRKVLEKAQKVRTIQEAKALTMAESPEFDQMLNRALEKLQTAASNTAGSLAESSASTPAD